MIAHRGVQTAAEHVHKRGLEEGSWTVLVRPRTVVRKVQMMSNSEEQGCEEDSHRV